MKYKILLNHFKDQKHEFIKFMEKAVSYKTYSGDTKNINKFLDYLVKVFKPFNPFISRVHTKKGDILCLSFSRKKVNFITLYSHVDTVKIIESPTKIRLKNGKLFGNGAYDMKNAIALFFFSLNAIKKLKLPIKKNIKIIFTPDEETGSKASKSYLLKKCKRSRAVIIPEPCGFNGGIKAKRKGIVFVEAKLTGKAAHSGIKFRKNSDANRALAKLILEIDRRIKKYSETSFNPGFISGGIGINVISPKSKLEGEVRSFSNKTLKKIASDIKTIEFIDKVKVKIRTEIYHPALEFDFKNRSLYKKAKIIADSIDYNLPVGFSGGASDGSDLSNAGIPVIDGLGMLGNGAHSKQEYIELNDFPYRATLITGLLKELQDD